MPQKAPFAAHPGKDADRSPSLVGCLAHFAWSVGGCGLLVILWVSILRGPAWTLSAKDALYWAAVLGMIAARRLDVGRQRGLDSADELPPSRDVRIYASGLIGTAGILWCVAQSFEV